MPDTTAYKSQIEDVLRQRYFSMIPPLAANRPAEEIDRNRLSRALAAFAIEGLADVVPAQAANAVVDAFTDNGIDAIFFDRPQNRLWIVQSKAGDAPDMGDIKKFCDGIRDIFAGRFDRFNDNFQRLQPDVEEALATPGLVVEGCPVYLANMMHPNVSAEFELLKEELNKFVYRFDWKGLNVLVLYNSLTVEYAAAELNISLMMENWYGIDQPHRAFYGLVTARQLADLYHLHGNALFQKNIRHYLGSQGINATITATVREQPGELFYLNNGLTAVSTSITPAPGANNEKGTFNFTGFSIVNGAQTVGSISSTHENPNEISSDAKLLITVIQIENNADNLGTRITRARNTQNAIKGLYFAALDPQQERLRRELAISGITYHYRPSAEVLNDDNTNVTLEQAALALACFRGDTRIIVDAKKEIGLIYDSSGTYYPAFFSPNLSGMRLCRAVRVFQYLDKVFADSERAETDGSRRMFYRHGRFFILHILARRYRSLLEKDGIDLSLDDKIELSRVALELAETVYEVAEARFHRSKGYLSIFRNATDAVPLAEDVMRRLGEIEAAQNAFVAAPAAEPLPTVQPAAAQELPTQTPDES